MSIFSIFFKNKESTTKIGSGTAIKVEQTLLPFDSVQSNIGGQIKYSQEKTGSSAVIRCDDNLVDIINLEVRGSTLFINFKNTGAITTVTNTPIEIFVTSSDLNRVEVSGITEFVCEKLKTQKLQVNASGSSRVQFESLQAQQLQIVTEGSAKLGIAGEAQFLRLRAEGVSKSDCSQLLASRAQVDTSGTATASVNCNEILKAVASGVSKIRVYGAAPDRDLTMEGLGKISLENEAERKNKKRF